MQWHRLHPSATTGTLGFIPDFVSEEDPRPAAEQFNERYIGRWRPAQGFTLTPDNRLHYPGDPPLLPLAETRLRGEVIRLYQFGWVCIVQPDGSFQISRMD